MSKSIAGLVIDLSAQEFNIGTDLLCSLTGIFNFEAWEIESKWNFEESSEKHIVKSESGHLHPGSAGPPHIALLTSLKVTLQSAIILGHLFL